MTPGSFNSLSMWGIGSFNETYSKEIHSWTLPIMNSHQPACMHLKCAWKDMNLYQCHTKTLRDSFFIYLNLTLGTSSHLLRSTQAVN